jgi:hypothetical protein
MLSDRFENALSQGGVKTILISLLCYVVLFVVDLIVVGGSTVAIFSVGIGGVADNLGGSVLIILLMLLFSAVLGSLIGAGQLGSFKDSVEGYTVSFNSYWKRSKQYFPRFFGYGLLCGVVTILLGIVLIGVPGIGGWAVSSFWLGMAQIIFAILINVYVLPQYYLIVLQFERQGFVSKNFLPMFIYSLMAGLLPFVPFIGYIFCALLQLFYPLFVLVLYKENADPPEQVGTPV